MSLPEVTAGSTGLPLSPISSRKVTGMATVPTGRQAGILTGQRVPGVCGTICRCSGVVSDGFFRFHMNHWPHRPIITMLIPKVDWLAR